MSHVIRLEIQVKDQATFTEVARGLGYRVEENTSVRFYDGTEVGGLGVYLPGWKYPVVVDAEGSVHYDNWKGHWGDITHLNQLVQEYAVSIVTTQAMLDGKSVYQEVRDDGTVILHVEG